MIKQDISLKEYTNYKIGGPARYFLEFKSIDELESGLRDWEGICAKNNIPAGKIFILGGGTNLLIDDEGYGGLVIHNKYDKIITRGELVEFGAGLTIEEINEYCISHSLSGLEWSGGLPGTLGGAIFGNAGAFGGETKDHIVAVKSFSLMERKIAERKNEQCGFGYRSSIFKEFLAGKEVILSATIELKKGSRDLIRKEVGEKKSYRQQRQPLEHPNAGSTFKNVDLRLCSDDLTARYQRAIKTDPFPVIPAAHLIYEAGLPGMRVGGIEVSRKHPNFLINIKSASSEDVETAIKIIHDKIEKLYLVSLEPEIIRLGD